MTYSNDYKINTIRLYNDRIKFNFSVKNIIKIQNIARSTLYSWINNKNDIVLNNKIKNKKKNKRFGKITPECKKYILDYVSEHKQFQMKKLLKHISKKFKIKLSKQSIYNVLKDNKITNKKVKFNEYPFTDEILKKSKNNLIEKLKKENFDVISQDECGIYLLTNNKYGWSKIGTECELKGQNKSKMKKFSLALAITKKKVVGLKLIKTSFNAISFNNFMMKNVKKNNNENKKYFLDNARIHHAKLLNKEIKDNCIYNVPYYSKFNPIEMFFNTLKNYLNTIYIKSEASLRRHINIFIKNIKENELNNYFNKAFSYLIN